MWKTILPPHFLCCALPTRRPRAPRGGDSQGRRLWWRRSGHGGRGRGRGSSRCGGDRGGAGSGGSSIFFLRFFHSFWLIVIIKPIKQLLQQGCRGSTLEFRHHSVPKTLQKQQMFPPLMHHTVTYNLLSHTPLAAGSDKRCYPSAVRNGASALLFLPRYKHSSFRTIV